MTPEEVKKKVEEDPDFVNLKRFDFSLKKLVERYPEGCPNRVILSALLMSEDELDKCYNGIVEKLRAQMGVKL